MVKNDFKFVAMLVADFFKQKHIQKRLDLIEERDITGWEIWLQVEFSVFLDTHIEVAEWGREFQYSIDRRKAKNREHMAIDFVIRKRSALKHWYIALELKQNSSVKSCIRGMMEDTRKVALVRGSHDDLRSMWTLGIHPWIEGEELESIVHKYADAFDVDLIPNCMVSEPIKRTELAYTIF